MLTSQVTDVLVNVFDAVVLPRYGRLASEDVQAKAPGDLVTIADREAEAELTAWLRAVDPDATVVGEEAVAADPELKGSIDTAAHVWLIDPVDGTGNFVKGNDDFGCLIAELVDGVPVRSWIWQGIRRRLFVTERGRGVRVEHHPIAAEPTATLSLEAPRPQRAMLVGGVTPEYADLRGSGLAVPLPMTGSCTADYPLIALGERDYLIHDGKQPWDHWPGLLMLEELGGTVAFLDGEPFSSTSANRLKLLAARSPQVWDVVAAAAVRGDQARLRAHPG